MLDKNAQNNLAKYFRSLHQPGNPLLLTNIWDAATAQAIVARPSTKAVATASFAIAATNGLKDKNLSWKHNLDRISIIAPIVNQAGIPLTCDIQDGYHNVTVVIHQLVEAGAVGCNLEDLDSQTGELRTLDDAVMRIKQARKAAMLSAVPDFCINARTDALYKGTIEEAITRGKAYLAAGATIVFWGGPKGRGVSSPEVRELVQAFGGKLNVKQNLRPGFLNSQAIAELGVARISIGPELYRKAMTAFQSALDELIGDDF